MGEWQIKPLLAGEQPALIFPALTDRGIGASLPGGVDETLLFVERTRGVHVVFPNTSDDSGGFG
jgi:hypothetical protein